MNSRSNVCSTPTSDEPSWTPSQTKVSFFSSSSDNESHGCKYAGISIHGGGGGGGMVFSLNNTAPPPPQMNKNHSLIYTPVMSPIPTFVVIPIILYKVKIL